ncbi:signal peptide peptidase SppA [uncultured Bacteroides sp.]|uniref:signal peptide peptidase SppA n=1 Tax=uncultured Bacteroides sp. TaxID=162156 RepID=UPI002AAA7E1B|nr:signal peptide peptidase SppA [uncultured Bacteroides sp.]
MKDFLKFTLATVVGIILSSIVIFFIGAIIFFGVVASSEKEVKVKPNSVMFLDLNGKLEERTEDNPFKQFVGEDFATYGLDDILSSIKKAKENENIKGIYIQAKALGASYASLQEIRNALVDFKKSGKFIVAYSDNYTQKLYYLSSVADKVLLNPKGVIEWKGLAAEPMFYKDLLKKVGVEMQIFRVGTYKSAVEPFIATEMSPANREQVSEYIGSIWNQILTDVSTSRKLSKDSLNAYADRMLMFYPSEKSVKCGLADSLIYKSGVRDYLKKLTKTGKDDDLAVLNLDDMINVKRNVPKDKSGNAIAVYYAFGSIDESTDEGIVSDKVVKDLRELRENKDIKAVVLRVNSPGGSAFGSEQIWNEVKALKKEKTVVVSMGDYAASGGYYISCVADCIVAEPTTLTGSIGIFGMFPNVKGLTDKIGLSFDVVKTNKFSDLGATGRGLNTDEQALIQMTINNGYDTFLSRCAEGRKMSKANIAKIAEGRVWTGEKAKKIGLVDELGGLDKAIEIAAKKVKLKEYTVLSYPEKKDFFSTIFKEKPTHYIESKLMESNFGELYQGFGMIKEAQKLDNLQARVPFDINIK